MRASQSNCSNTGKKKFLIKRKHGTCKEESMITFSRLVLCPHRWIPLIRPQSWLQLLDDAHSLHAARPSSARGVSRITGWLNSNGSLLRGPGRFTPESTCQTPFPPRSVVPLNTQPASDALQLHMEREQTLKMTQHEALGIHRDLTK